MNDQHQQELSELGIARRDQMLSELKVTLRKNQRRKKIQRAVLASSLAVGLSAVMAWQLLTPDLNDQISVRSQPARAVTDESTDVQLDMRPVAKPKVLEFGLVSNDEILDLLNEVGQPTALAKINNQWVAIPLGSDVPGQ